MSDIIQKIKLPTINSFHPYINTRVFQDQSGSLFETNLTDISASDDALLSSQFGSGASGSSGPTNGSSGIGNAAGVMSFKILECAHFPLNFLRVVLWLYLIGTNF